MRLRDYVDPDLVFTGLVAADGQELLGKLAGLVCRHIRGLDRDTCHRGLMDRMREFGTGLECGIAVPHAMIAGLDRTVMLVATLEKPLDLGTLDGSLVKLVFMLLSPPDAATRHIRILARLARFCALGDFLERISEAPDAAALYRVLVEEDERHV